MVVIFNFEAITLVASAQFAQHNKGTRGQAVTEKDSPEYWHALVAHERALGTQWQPIETAPKDRDILITGRYANGIAYVEESHWDYRGHFKARQFEPPTHWMPMPKPYGGWGSLVETLVDALPEFGEPGNDGAGTDYEGIHTNRKAPR